jgi:serine/threonine protein kinase
MKEFREGCTFNLNLFEKPQTKSLCQLKCFLNSPNEQRVLGVPILGVSTRLLLVEDFLRTLSILHSTGIIVGDISESNLVVQRKKDAITKNRMIFLDVDSFSHVNRPNPLGAESTPGWWAPEQTGNTAQVSHQTDVFKASLLVKRFLHHVNESPSDSFRLKTSAVLSKFLISNNGRHFKALLDKGTGSLPSERPTSKQLSAEFTKFLDHYLSRG